MKEVEILSGITQEAFDEKVLEFTEKFGEPKPQKRLGVLFGNYSVGNNIDTRIKITNGVPHIIQKVGEGLSASRTNKEYDMILDMKADEILSLARMFQRIGGMSEGFTSPMQQYDNLIFQSPKAEIKMYRQFNSQNMFYGFEVEVDDPKANVMEVCQELGLQPDDIDRDAQYWYDYDKQYNEDSLEMSDTDLKELIEKYLEKID